MEINNQERSSHRSHYHLLHNALYKQLNTKKSKNNLIVNKGAAINAAPTLSGGLQYSAKDKNTLFQLCKTPMAANWIKNNDSNSYTIANQSSANLDIFFVPGLAGIDISYRELLSCIKSVDYSETPAYLAAMRDTENIINEIQYMVKEIDKEYKLWCMDNRYPETGFPLKTMDEWLYDKTLGAIYRIKRDYLYERLQELDEKRAKIKGDTSSLIKKAIADYDSDEYRMKINISGNPISVPAVSISGDLTGDKKRWDTVGNEKMFDLLINRSTLSGQISNTGEFEGQQTSFIKSSLYSENDIQAILSDTNYELRFTAVGLQSYDIIRSGWFHASFIDPDMSIDGGLFTNDSFFGKKGSLHLIPVSLLVMYKPTIELTLSERCYRQLFQENLNSNSNYIDVFCYRFSIDSGNVSGSSGVVKMVIESSKNAVPQIVGVTSQIAYNGK